MLGFKIKNGQAKREGYDKTRVKGMVMYDDDFNGCPHCGSKQFYICHCCGKVCCYHGQDFVTCPTSSVKPTPGKKMSKEDMFEYLLSIVEIDPSFQSVTGLTVKSVSFDIDDSKEFTVICEITGTLSVTSFDITIGIYDNNGRVRKKECYSVYNHCFKNYDMVSIYVDSPITIANISKVRVFVTDISY